MGDSRTTILDSRPENSTMIIESKMESLGVSKKEELIDEFCDPENPVKIPFQEVSAAAYKIKGGIPKTPCEVRTNYETFRSLRLSTMIILIIIITCLQIFFLYIYKSQREILKYYILSCMDESEEVTSLRTFMRF